MRNHAEVMGKEGLAEPEFRLPPAIAGAPLVTFGLLFFGWTTYSSIPWIVPIVGSAFFGAGWVVIFVSTDGVRADQEQAHLCLFRCLHVSCLCLSNLCRKRVGSQLLCQKHVRCRLPIIWPS